MAVLRVCDCGWGTDNPDRLEIHLMESGHRERVPWWDQFTRIILASW